MNRHTPAAIIVALQLALSLSGAEFKVQNHTFTLPDGFEIELVAGTNLVQRPVSASFDELGRLYVTDSSGSNDKPDKQLADKPHRVLRLDAAALDGRFEKSTVFADKMMFPEGALWFEDSLYVSAPPSIWKLTDTDGDGIADQREEWFQGKTLTGCANDLHGPYLGPDGWIYWCKGAFAEQTYQLPNGKDFRSKAAHIFRARPDGSGLEPVLTGGMDNPVGLAFSAEGERFLVGTFFQNPQGGRRDGIIHAIYGGVYGKQNDVLDGHKRTGDLMPIMTHLGPAAPCSVIRYESGVFGDAYRDNLFVCNFNLHKVTRHVLEPDGATFKTRDSDFLVSDNSDFHPTDVLEDADGSLLVIDTGGWYKLCCPTSQLAKPDVLGAIYRVRKKGAPKINDPRGSKIDWTKLSPPELAGYRKDPRPAVSKRAIQALARQPGPSTPISSKALDTAALQSISLHRDTKAVPQLVATLQSGRELNRRLAAEALGRIGAREAVPVLLKMSSSPHDRALDHALIYALIEIGDAETTAAGLRSENSGVRRAALIAVDQMDEGGLKAGDVTPLLASTDSSLKQTASWIVGHHPEWGGALAGYFRDRLAAKKLSEPDRGELQKQLSGFGRNAAIQELLASTLHGARPGAESASIVLGAMAKSGVKETPAAWMIEVAGILNGDDVVNAREAVATARALPTPKTGATEWNTALLRVARKTDWPPEVRLEALAAMSRGLAKVDAGLFEFLRQNVAPGNSVLTRSAAASVLARAKLDPGQLLDLTESIKTGGPLEVPKLLAAYEKSTNEALGLKLIAALKESKGAAGLRAEILQPRLTNFPVVIQQQGEALLNSLNEDGPKQKKHLEDLLAALPQGDIRRGQAIFNSPKAACASCHAIGYLGGHVGPDLTSIGQIRTERDLLESIVYPSASFVRSFEPMVVATRGGEEINGIVQRDNAEEIVLTTGPNAEVRIARAEVVEMRPGSTSLMPGGLADQLTQGELADLVTFLKSTKWGPR